MSVHRKRGLSISWYHTCNPVDNNSSNSSISYGKHENVPNIHREFADNFPKKCFSRN